MQAAFFGLWHIVVPAREYIDGNMTLQMALLMAFGYAVLSFMMGFKLGLLVGYTGAIWAGFFEHTFNNTVVNMLHVVSATGTDELQIVRVMIAQILSFVLVVCYGRVVKKRQDV